MVTRMSDASARPHPSIPDLLGAPDTAFSFEFFPPRDDASEAVLWDSIRRIERIHPSFISVTYGAGGSTRDRTVRITGRIEHETTLTTMAHLTCVGSSVAELRQIVGQYAGAGIRNILALRGDPAGGLQAYRVARYGDPSLATNRSNVLLGMLSAEDTTAQTLRAEAEDFAAMLTRDAVPATAPSG